MMRMRTSLAALALMASLGGAAGARESSRGEQGKGEQLQVENEIRTKLVADPDLKNTSVDIRVEDGTATLDGTVDTESERAKADRLARVKGVRRVDNQLEVRGPGTKATAMDDAISAKLKGLYLTNTMLRYGTISVTTTDGIVTLSGTVPSEEARQQAVDIARNARGVKKVDDNMLVSGPSQPMAPPQPMR